MNRLRLLPALALLQTLMGCSSAWDPVIVPERELPASFGVERDGGGEARVGPETWRDWLGSGELVDLLQEALVNNQDVLIAQQRIEKARARVLAARGARLPSFDFGAAAGVEKFGLFTAEGAGNASTDIEPDKVVPETLPDFTLGLVSAWELDLWGRLRSLRKAARSQYLASVEGTHLVLTSLVAELASAYFELLALDHSIDILRRSEERLGAALRVVRLQKAAGRTNELAVKQFEAELAEMHSRESELLQQAVETENRINLLIGRYPQPLDFDPTQLLAQPSGAHATGVPSELLRNRPDVRAAERELEAAEFDVEAARAAFFPTLTIRAGVGYEAYDSTLMFHTPESLAYSAAAGLTAPLFNRAALEANLIDAKAGQLEAVHAYQRSILAAYVEVVDALANIENSDAIIAARTKRKDALTTSIGIADALFRAGKANYLEVLVAQQSALQAELDLVDALLRRRVANIVAYKALGGGWR